MSRDTAKYPLTHRKLTQQDIHQAHAIVWGPRSPSLGGVAPSFPLCHVSCIFFSKNRTEYTPVVREDFIHIH